MPHFIIRLVLDELDKELTNRGHDYVRYADDIVIALSSQKSASRVEGSVVSFIERSFVFVWHSLI